jgi:hypothetical protein
VFTQFTRNAVLYLSFSREGERLIALGNDTLHSLSLFASPSKQWIAREREGDAVFVTSASVSPHPLAFCLFASSRDFSLLVGGQDGVLHMFRPPGRSHGSLSLNSAKMYLEHVAKHQALLCAVETTLALPPHLFSLSNAEGLENKESGESKNRESRHLGRGGSEEIPVVLIGTSDGLLYVLSCFENRAVHRVSAHFGECLAVCVAEQTLISYSASTHYGGTGSGTGRGHKILTLGGDGLLKIWSSTLTGLATIDLARHITTSSLSLGISAGKSI